MPNDIAIVNGAILPMNGRPLIPNGAITITGNSITAVGATAEIDLDATKTIDARGCVVMPGFANSHTHVASNLLLRGLLEDVLLFEWLQTMWRLKQNFDHETLYWASLCGDLEMLKAGITSFNEHFDAYDVEPQIEALDEIPLRATLGYGFADILQELIDTTGLPVQDVVFNLLQLWGWASMHCADGTARMTLPRLVRTCGATVPAKTLVARAI